MVRISSEPPKLFSHLTILIISDFILWRRSRHEGVKWSRTAAFNDFSSKCSFLFRFLLHDLLHDIIFLKDLLFGSWKFWKTTIRLLWLNKLFNFCWITFLFFDYSVFFIAFFWSRTDLNRLIATNLFTPLTILK